MRRTAAVVLVCLVCSHAQARKLPWQLTLERKLNNETVRLEIDGSPLGKVLLVFGRITRLSVVLDPHARTRDKRSASEAVVRIDALDIPARQFLERILKPRGLRYVIANQVVFVTDDPLWSVDVTRVTMTEVRHRKLTKKPVTMEVDGRALRDVIESVGRITGVPVEFRSPPPWLGTPVTCVLHEVPANAFLDWAAHFLGLRWAVEDRHVIFGDPVEMMSIRTRRILKETKVTFDCNGLDAMAALKVLLAKRPIDFRPDPNVFTDANFIVTLNLNDASLEEALDRFARQLNLHWTVRSGTVVITDEKGLRKQRSVRRTRVLPVKPTARDRKVKQQLEETIVAFTFNEQPCLEAFDFLQTLGNVNIVLDRSVEWDLNATITLKLTNVPLEVAVPATAEQIGGAFIIRDGVVFVSTEPGLMRRAEEATRSVLSTVPTEADRKVHQRLRQTIVSFTFNEQPVMAALDFFQTLGNVNIVPDRRRFTDPDQTVTLKLTNVPLRTALIFLVEQLGLRYVIQDGVIFVSDEQTIRKRSARNERIFFANKPSEIDLRVYRQLKETVVSFHFNEQPIMEALDFLQTLGTTSVRPDRSKFEDPDRTVTLKLTNVSLWTAVKLLTEQLNLRCVIRKGVVFISDEAGVRRK